MKRPFLSLLLLCLTASPAWTQAVEPRPQPGRPARVAVVNLGRILSSSLFMRNRVFDPFPDEFGPLREKEQRVQKEIEHLEDALTGRDFSRANEDELNAAIAKHREDKEKLRAEIQRLLAKRQEANLISIWTEIQTAIKTYAIENKIDLVLGHGDPLDKELLNRFPNIDRKKQAMDNACAVPLFLGPPVDISDEVIGLIHKLRAEKWSK